MINTPCRNNWQFSRKIILSLFWLGVSPTLFAQTDDSATGTTSGDAEPIEEVVVTGIRGALKNAIDQKRAANVIQDGISADDIGNIPDLDLGEALVRIPGVQIDRDQERRGSSISVRGLPASFTKTTVNGQNIANPTAARFRVNPFGAFDSSVFSGANVIKSFTADTQSGGLASNVDLQITPALSRPDGQLIMRAELGYEETPEAWNPGLFVSGAKHFGDGNFGAFASVAYSKLEFRRDIVTMNSYGNLIPRPNAANPEGRFLDPTNPEFEAQLQALDPDLNTPDDYSVWFPDRLRQFTEISEGDRITAAGGIEWKQSETLSFRMDGLFTKRELDENLLSPFEVDLRSPNTIVTPVGSPVSAGNFEGAGDVYYFPEVAFSNATIRPGNRTFDFLEQTWGIYPQLRFQNDDWDIRAIATISEAKNQFIQEMFELNALPAAGGLSNGITGAVNTGAGDIGNYSLFVDIPSDAYVFTGFPTGSLSGPGTTAPFNGGANSLALTANNQRVERSLFSLQLDAERFVDLGPITSIKAGVRYQEDDALNLREFNSLNGAQVENVDSSIFISNPAQTSGNTFFGGEAPGYLQENWLSLNLDALRGMLLPIDVARLRTPWAQNFLTPWIREYPITRRRAFNWESDREEMEAYVMAFYDFGKNGDLPVRGNFGLRFVDTELSGNLIATIDSEGNVVADATPVARSSYDDVLPSLNIIADLSDNLVLNAAYFKTFEAVDLVEFDPSPTSYVTGDDNGDTFVDNALVTASSLDREARTSDSWELGLNWYNDFGGLIGFTYFEKTLAANYQNTLVCPSSVTAFAPNSVTFTGLSEDGSGVCRTGADVDVVFGGGASTLPAGSEIEVTAFVASDKDVNLKGFEFQAQQTLEFLDGWYKDLGFVANYSYNDPSEKLYGVSKYTYNLIGFYENEDFGVRLVSNHRSKNFLPAGGGFQGGEREVRGRTQVDLSVNVTAIENWDLRFEIFNLNEAQRDEYEFVPGMMRRTDWDGRIYNVSATFYGF